MIRWAAVVHTNDSAVLVQSSTKDPDEMRLTSRLRSACRSDNTRTVLQPCSEDPTTTELDHGTDRARSRAKQLLSPSKMHAALIAVMAPAAVVAPAGPEPASYR
jgi:hypothetical protein